MDTQVMLILILIVAQYSQKAVCSFEKGFHRQNHSSSGFPHPVKQIPPVKFLIPPLVGYPPPPTLTTIWKAPYIYISYIIYPGGNTELFFWGGTGNSSAKKWSQLRSNTHKKSGDLYSIHALVARYFGYIGLSLWT